LGDESVMLLIRKYSIGWIYIDIQIMRIVN
jgi:hypothetical protein